MNIITQHKCDQCEEKYGCSHNEFGLMHIDKNSKSGCYLLVIKKADNSEVVKIGKSEKSIYQRLKRGYKFPRILAYAEDMYAHQFERILKKDFSSKFTVIAGTNEYHTLTNDYQTCINMFAKSYAEHLQKYTEYEALTHKYGRASDKTRRISNKKPIPHSCHEEQTQPHSVDNIFIRNRCKWVALCCITHAVSFIIGAISV